MEALALRVRELENLDTPVTRQLTEEVHYLRARVIEMNEHGTVVSQIHLRQANERMTRLDADLIDLEHELNLKADAKAVEAIIAERKWLRTTVAVALIGAVVSILVQIISKAIGDGL